MRTASFVLLFSSSLSLAIGCLPTETVVLTRAGDASADAPTTDSPNAPDVATDTTAVNDAGVEDVPTGKDVVTDVAPPDTDEVWPARVVNASVGCASGQWCWENPVPHGESVFDAFALSATDVWAVGGHGLAMRWNGTAWTRVETGTTADLRRVWASGPSDVWATTFQYTDAARTRFTYGLLRWDGTRWSTPPLPAGARPNLVHGSGARDVWIVSQPETSGPTTVWRYDGARWSAVSEGLPTGGVAVRDLWVEREGRVWMYGGVPGEAHPYDVYRYEGGRWTRVESARDSVSNQAFTGRIAGANGEVYVLTTALGGFNTWSFVNLSQTPARYERVSVGTRTYTDTVLSAGGRLWYVGSDIYRREGAQWVATGVPRPMNNRVRLPTTFAASDANTGWAFNAYADQYRMSAGTWALTTAEDKPELRGLAARGGVPIAYGTGVYTRSANGAWSRSPFTTTDTLGVAHDPTGALRWVIVAPGRAMRVEGATLVDASPADATVISIWMPDTTTAWATFGATTGSRFRRWDGSRWNDAPALPARIGDVDGARVELGPVWADGRDVWVAGGMRRVTLENDLNGILCRLRDGAWTCVDLARSLSEPTPVEALWGTPATVPSNASGLWALVARRLVRVDRETLARTSVGLATGADSFGRLVGNERTGDLALVGTNVTILRPGTRNAEEYRAPLSGYTGGVGAVFPADDGGFWVTAANGGILRYR